MAAECTNCGSGHGDLYSLNDRPEPIIFEIPKGTTFEQFINNQICPRCGCAARFHAKYFVE